MSDDDAPLVRAVRRFVSGDPDRDPVIIDRVRLLRLLDLAEEAIRLRGVRDAAMAAAKDLTGGELFIDDKNGIGLIAACAALAPDDAQLRAALDAAKEKP